MVVVVEQINQSVRYAVYFWPTIGLGDLAEVHVLTLINESCTELYLICFFISEIKRTSLAPTTHHHARLDHHGDIHEGISLHRQITPRLEATATFLLVSSCFYTLFFALLTRQMCKSEIV